MLYAIISDIHANMTAWKSVLADVSALKADRIICLGDVVGYGPEPAETLESVYRHVDAFVMGNHDAVVAGKMSAECFNEHARKLIEWSVGRISSAGRAFLGRQPLVLQTPGFTCAHGSPANPEAFDYILTEEEALAAFGATDRQLIFVGHTHQPGIAVLGASGTAHMLRSQDFELEPGKRFIVNTGSVGDPRDEDPRASYCLYDDTTRVVRFRRVAFDYGQLAERVKAAGLDEREIPLLRRDPVPKREPVRETLGFAPPRERKAMARGVETRRELSELKRTNRRLRTAVAALVVTLAAIAGATIGVVTRPERSPFTPPEAIAPVETQIARELLSSVLPPIPPPSGEIESGCPIDGWRYSIEDPTRQRICLVKEPSTGANAIEIRNEGRLHFVLEAPHWLHGGLASGMRIQAILQAKASEDFVGRSAIRITANPDTPREHTLMNEELLLTKPGTLQQTKRTMEKKSAVRIEDSDERILFRIETSFSGTLLICDPRMTVVK